jgi:hypothetical protein
LIRGNGRKFTTNGSVSDNAVEVISVVPNPMTLFILDNADAPFIVKSVVVFVKVNLVVILLYVMANPAGISNRS